MAKFNVEIRNQCRHCLQKGAEQLGLTLSDLYLDQMINYLSELSHWNSSFNLTAITDPPDMVWRHIVDSLTCVPFIQGGVIADMATGAGLPGIPLAAHLPEKSFTLIDSNGKKIRFIRQVCALLGLKNVQVEHTRVEKYKPSKTFHTITARAFATIPVMISLSQQLLSAKGQFVFMKGKRPQEELNALPPNWHVEIHAVGMPKTVSHDEVVRHIVVVTRGKQ